jgi:hypothetical protein
MLYRYYLLYFQMFEMNIPYRARGVVITVVYGGKMAIADAVVGTQKFPHGNFFLHTTIL